MAQANDTRTAYNVADNLRPKDLASEGAPNTKTVLLELEEVILLACSLCFGLAFCSVDVVKARLILGKPAMSFFFLFLWAYFCEELTTPAGVQVTRVKKNFDQSLLVCSGRDTRWLPPFGCG